MTPTSYGGEAFNPVPDSRNRIHADDVARQFGFEGALVPGVVISAYLAHPAVVAWEKPWLDRGVAHVTIVKPLYDRRRFDVVVRPDGRYAYDAELIDVAGTRVASGRFELPSDVPLPPARRGVASAGEAPVSPTAEGIDLLKRRGMRAMRKRWPEGSEIVSYFRDPREMPELLRPDAGGFANTAFVLGLTNWIFAENVALGPWVHLETESRHFAAVPPGSEVVAEASVVDRFEKKGHHFVDVDVAGFLADGTPIVSVRLRAIYRLRGV